METSSNVDISLIESALEVLLENHQNPEPNVRIICVQVAQIILINVGMGVGVAGYLLSFTGVGGGQRPKNHLNP